MRILSIKELQGHLGVSRSTLHRYMKEKGFPFIKVSGKLMFNLDDVNSFLEKFSSHHSSKSSKHG